MSPLECPDCLGEGGEKRVDEVGNEDWCDCRECGGKGTLACYVCEERPAVAVEGKTRVCGVCLVEAA